MAKITAIHGGGDWYDASADYVILPAEMDVDVAVANYRKWYQTEYRPHRRPGTERPNMVLGHFRQAADCVQKYLTLVEWLVSQGARIPTEDELEIFQWD